MRGRRLTGSGDPTPDGGSRRVPVLAALLAVALFAASIAGFLAARRSLRDDDERSFETRSDVIGRRVQLLVDDLVAVASGTGGSIAYARSTGEFVPGRDLSRVTAGLLVTVGVRDARLEDAYPVAAAGDPLSVAVRAARVTAEPRMAAPSQPGGPPVLVVPGYRDVTVPADVAARLSAGGPDLLVGVDPGAIVERAVTRSPTVRISVTDAGVPLAEFGADGGPRSPAVMRDVEVAGRVWTVTILPRAAFARDAFLPWGILLGGLLLSAAALAAAWFVRRSSQAMRARAEARERELASIAEAGPLLQQSLELAEVLPDFVVRLSDDFDLERVALLVGSGADGQQREVFTVGTAGGRRPVGELPVNPDAAASGEEFLLRLHRSGRAVGALRIKPRAAVGATRMRALVALGDLLAAAVGNIQLYADEQETVRRLQEVDRLKNDFVSTVSHELRTTTTAIAGFGELLEKQWDALPDDTRRDFLGRVTRNAGTLRLLVDDMLDFSRLDRMTLNVTPDLVDLSATVAATVDQIASLLERHEIQRDIEPGIDAWTDARAVERILANLLSNAAKFSPVDSRVSVALRRVDHRAELSVSDQGPGVAPDDRTRIFARFYRGTSAAARATRGAGVGLAIVLDLVERLGAGIEVGDAPGGGARFVVMFPLEQPAAAGGGLAVDRAEVRRDPIP